MVRGRKCFAYFRASVLIKSQGWQVVRSQSCEAIAKLILEQNVHAIGDKANHVVLDGIEEATGANLEALPRRFRLEHAQIMTQADLRRAVKLGGERVLLHVLSRIHGYISDCELSANACDERCQLTICLVRY